MARKIFKIIKTGFRDTIEIACKELRHIFKDPGVLIIFFAAGLLYPITYGFIYKNEVLRDVSIAVVDFSHTSLSRQFIRHLDATPEVAVNYQSTSMAEAKELYAKDKVMGIILIPSSFSEDIHAGIQTHVSAYASMVSMLYYKAIYSSVNYVALDLGQRIQVSNLMSSGMSQHEAVVSAAPVINEGVALFNTQGGYPSFLIPCVLILIIQQTMVLGVGILSGTAREENTYRNLIPISRKYHGTLRIVSGKAIAYFILYVFIGIYNLVVIPEVFNLPRLADFFTLCAFMLPFLLACVFFSMSISVFFYDREEVFLLFLFSSLPLLFMSGLTWPADHIPTFWRMFSGFFPSTFGIRGFVKINTMGASIGQIGFELLWLWIQAGVYFVFSFFVYRWQIMESERKL